MSRCLSMVGVLVLALCASQAWAADHPQRTTKSPTVPGVSPPVVTPTAPAIPPLKPVVPAPQAVMPPTQAVMPPTQAVIMPTDSVRIPVAPAAPDSPGNSAQP